MSVAPRQDLEAPSRFLSTKPSVATIGAASLAPSVSLTVRGEPELHYSADGKIVSPHPKDFGFLPVPRWLRYNPDIPFSFGLPLNIAFAVATAFVAGNLYYCQPLLIELAQSFGVSQGTVSRIPTLLQAGYVTGLLLISPLGDLVRRRQLILTVILLSLSFIIGLSVTKNVIVFQVLSFLTGVVNVAPQVLFPLTADLAPPHRRASAISIVFTGLLFGILMARVIAGVIGEFVTWRAVYYLSIGLQAVVLFGGYLIIPDYPKKNAGISYFGILGSMAKLAVTEPTLIQACLIMMAGSAIFANFWTTLTFLLGGPHYNFSTLGIGLFGLVGLAGVVVAPILGRLVDAFVIWYAVLIATVGAIVIQAVYVGAAGIHIAAIVVVCFGLDLFVDLQQIALSTSIFGISAEARSRLNAVFIISVSGTAAGTKLYETYGWRASGAFSIALVGFQFFMLFLRGPHIGNNLWFGYKGGWSFRIAPSPIEDVEKRSPSAQATTSSVQDDPEKDSHLGHSRESTAA